MAYYWETNSCILNFALDPQDLSPVTPDINQKVKEKNQSFHNDKSKGKDILK